MLEEPADQPWGERMATVTDPDGNRVIVPTRAPRDERGPRRRSIGRPEQRLTRAGRVRCSGAERADGDLHKRVRVFGGERSGAV